MTSKSKDPRWINSKFDGNDRNGTPYKKGERVFYYPLTRVILAGAAAEQAARDFAAAVADEGGF